MAGFFYEFCRIIFYNLRRVSDAIFRLWFSNIGGVSFLDIDSKVYSLVVNYYYSQYKAFG